jgi:hypothetical protein
VSWSAAALTVALFPTGDHHELSLGSYGHQLTPASTHAVDSGPVGLELRYRRVFDTDNPDVTPTGETARLRLYRDADGNTHIDHFEIETLLASFRVRPELGDKLDVGLLFGTWNEIWVHSDSGRAQWRVHTPITLTALGLANSDMDDQDRLKWYGAAGLGIGMDWIRRVRGPVGLQARAQTDISSKLRWLPGSPATVRQEWTTTAEAGVTWLRDAQSLALTGWAETVTQWDPRDATGRDGVDRQYLAAGLAVSGRVYQGRVAQAEPDLAVLAGELEAAAALVGLEADIAAESPAEEDNTALSAPLVAPEVASPGGSAAVEAIEAGPRIEGPPEDPGILTVHWSELQVLEQAQATAAGAGPCTMRFVLDAEGVPTDVLAVSCPEDLIAPGRSAGLRWRFEPFLDGDRAVPVQVVFPIQFEPPP